MKGIHAVVLIASVSVSGATLSSYHIGNSIIDQFDGIPTIASSKGDVLNYKRKSIPGAGIEYNYHNGGIPSDLSGNRYDIIMPLSFCNGAELGVNNDAKYSGLYYDAGLANNAACRCVIFTQWPAMSFGAWSTVWNRSLDTTQPGYAQPYGSAAYNMGMLARMRVMYPGKPVHLVPVGHVMDEFNTRAVGGKIAGFTSVTGLYADDIHLNSQGKYMQCLTGYAVFFKKDPHGAGLSIDQWSGTETVSQAFANVAADIVWTVIQRMTDQTGVPKTNVAPAVQPFSIARDARPDDFFSVNGALLGRGIRAAGHSAALMVLVPRTGETTVDPRK